MPSLPSRFPVELGSVQDPAGQVGRLHRLAVAGGPSWSLVRLLRRVVQVDGENSAGQTGLFLAALMGHSSAVQLFLAFGANPNHRCLDGSTPTHAGAFSGCGAVMLHLLQAGGDLRLHDQQGRSPRDWAKQGGAVWHGEVLELLQLCHAHTSALVRGGELAPAASLGQLRASSGPTLCGSLSSLRLVQADRVWRPGQIRRSPQIPALGIGQLSSLQPLALAAGVPLVDPQELLPAQGEPDRAYESSSHTIMASLLWRDHPMTVRQLKTPATHPDVLVADLQHCSMLHHPNLLLLMALSPTAGLGGLCLLFEPVGLGSLHHVLHPASRSGEGPLAIPGLLPGPLLLQVLEALLFLQARSWAHGGLSSHAVQLVRPGLAKVGHLEHGRPLPQPWLRPRPQRGCPQGGPGPGLPPPPELYRWLPLELIRGDAPTTTSDLYSFCLLAQEVFTGELPWAGREGPEVKAELEAGESPALDPLVPAPYQALVQAGLGLVPTDRRGSLQSARYVLREAVAQDLTPEASSSVGRTTMSLAPQSYPPEHLYYEVGPRAKVRPRLVPQGPVPSQNLEPPEVMGCSKVQSGASWASGSSLTLASSASLGEVPSPSPDPSPSSICFLDPSATGPAPAPQPSGVSLPAGDPELCGTVLRGSSQPRSKPFGVAPAHMPAHLTGPQPAPSTEPMGGDLIFSLQKMNLLEEIMVELQSRCHLGEQPHHSPIPGPDS